MINLSRQKISLSYGDKKVNFEFLGKNFIPPNKEISIVKCNLTQLLQEKLEKNESLRNKISLMPEDGKVVLVVDDYTRPTPTKIILPIVIDYLNKNGVKDYQIKLLMASGFHREMTVEEKELKYGKEILKRVQCIYHDANDHSNLGYLGKTSLGIPIYINRCFLESSITIGIGVIEIHPWAGFSGGGKIISPGIAGKATIDHTHALPVLYPNVEIAKTKNNPFYESCLEICKKANLDFLLNVILNVNQEPANLVFGDNIDYEYNSGIMFFNRINRITYSKKADIVLTTANPKHQSFGQSLTASFNASRLIKDGGIRIILAACPEDFGDSAFEKLFYYDALVRKWDSAKEFWRTRKGAGEKNSRNGCAFYRHLVCTEKSKLYFVSEAFPDFVEKFKTLKIFRNPQLALKEAMNELGENSSIIAFDLGGMALASLES